MPRLPIPGGDNGDWGDILNAFLDVSHNSDGSLANNTVGTNQLQSGAVTNEKLDNPTQAAIALANSAVPSSQLGTADGVAQLDSNSTLKTSQLPSSVVSATGATAEFVPIANGEDEYAWGPQSGRVGPPSSYTFLDADAADPASWYGSGAFVKIWGTWTPTASGPLVLLAPTDAPDGDQDNFDIYIWQGNVPNVDYPDATAASGSFSSGTEIDVSYGQAVAILDVVEGTPYTVILVDWATGTPGDVLNLSPLLNSIAPFGDVAQSPPAPVGAYQFAQAVVDHPTDGVISFGMQQHNGGAGYFPPYTIEANAYVASTGAQVLAGFAQTITGIFGQQPAGGHVGPFISDLTGPVSGGIGIPAAVTCELEFGVFRLDGTASIVVTSPNGGVTIPANVNPPNEVEYNTGWLGLLDWTTTVTLTGDDLSLVNGGADADCFVQTVAGGYLFAYFKFTGQLVSDD